MNALRYISMVWQKLSLIQRALLSAVTLTFLIVGVMLVQWARRPDMRLLYQELVPEEASKITEKISEKGIAYRLQNGGTSIYVPKENVYQLRLDMAKEGLPAGEQSGYKLFDNEKIGVSPFVQSVNLKRALQEELAKSIQMIDGVVYARVHIVSAEKALFKSAAEKTTASVVLRLRPGYRLSSLNVAAITHLVSGSVEGLNAEGVTVIDSQGHLLSSKSDQAMTHGAGTVQDFRERVEQNLARKVEDMLTTVLGPDRAVVRVHADIDMNSVSIASETPDPTTKAVTKEEIMTSSEPVAGTASGGQAGGASELKKQEDTSTEYEFGKTVKQEVILPGTIRSLSVAAFVDLYPDDANEAGTGGNGLIMQLTDVEEAIKNSLGLKDTSALKVVNVKFPRTTEPLIEDEPSNWPRYMAIVRHASLGIMAICALLVLRIFRGAKKKVAPPAAAEQLPAAENAAGLLPPGTQSPEPLAIRRQIAHALQTKPEQVRQLFYSWIEEKE